jgi:hypothetical protein
VRPRVQIPGPRPMSCLTTSWTPVAGHCGQASALPAVGNCVWVDGESADEFSVLRRDADVGAGDQQSDLAVLVGHADGDVAKLAQVAQGAIFRVTAVSQDSPELTQLSRPGIASQSQLPRDEMTTALD